MLIFIELVKEALIRKLLKLLHTCPAYAGNWELGAGNWELRTENWELRTGN